MVVAHKAVAHEAVQPKPPHRGRSTKRAPRRWNHGELRGVVECNINSLWEASLVDREHPPPPEVLYNSYNEALDVVNK